MNFIAEVDELFYETFIPKATKSRVQKYEYEHVIGVEDGDEHMVRANVGTVVVVGVLSVTVSHTYSPAWTELHLWSMCAQKHACHSGLLVGQQAWQARCDDLWWPLSHFQRRGFVLCVK